MGARTAMSLSLIEPDLVIITFLLLEAILFFYIYCNWQFERILNRKHGFLKSSKTNSKIIFFKKLNKLKI